MQNINNRFIFGCGAISGEGKGYGLGPISASNSHQLLEYAYNKGVRTFDCAPVYGMGVAETRLGSFIHPYRENCVVITKGGVDWHDSGRINMTNDPQVIEKMLHQSLKRLNTDYIDIYYIHWPDSKVDIRHSMEVLAKAQLQGKIKHIGLSNTNTDEYHLASQIGAIEYIQAECNLLRDPLQKLSKVILDDGIKSHGWGTFDKGILAGTVTIDSKFANDDCRSWAPWWKKSNWKSNVKKVEDFNRSFGDIYEAALGYSLTRDYNGHPIVGFRTLEHIDKALEIEINQELISQAMKFFNE